MPFPHTGSRLSCLLPPLSHALSGSGGFTVFNNPPDYFSVAQRRNCARRDHHHHQQCQCHCAVSALCDALNRWLSCLGLPSPSLIHIHGSRVASCISIMCPHRCSLALHPPDAPWPKGSRPLSLANSCNLVSLCIYVAVMPLCACA